MKKYLLLFIMAIFAISETHVFATACNDKDVESLCAGGKIFDSLGNEITTSYSVIDMGVEGCDLSDSGIECYLKTCGDKCYCAPKGYSCPGGGLISGEVEAKCKVEQVSWNTAISNGVQTGTCSTQTAYRCVDGYYIDGLTEKPKTDYNYSYDSITCTACPKYKDDILSNGKPVYVATTDGAGLNLKSECYIKAEESITDNIGKFVFNEDCNY